MVSYFDYAALGRTMITLLAGRCLYLAGAGQFKQTAWHAAGVLLIVTLTFGSLQYEIATARRAQQRDSSRTSNIIGRHVPAYYELHSIGWSSLFAGVGLMIAASIQRRQDMILKGDDR